MPDSCRTRFPHGHPSTVSSAVPLQQLGHEWRAGFNLDPLPLKLPQQFGTVAVDKAETGEIENGKHLRIARDEQVADFFNPWPQQLTFELDRAICRAFSGICNSQH